MGFFSGIKKAGKKIVKGVKKTFKKVGKFVGKVMGNKWVRRVMIASAVFTGGMALAAGWQGFTAQSGSLLTKFVTGAKDFMTALSSPVATAKSGLAGESMAASVQAAQAAGGATNAAAAALQPAAEAAQTVAGAAPGPLQGGANALSQAAPAINPSVTVAPAAQPGFLSRAASAAGKFASTPGGGQIIAGAIQGYGEGAAAEELAKETWRRERYYDDQYDPSKNPEGLARLRAAGKGGVTVPPGYLKRAMDSANAIPNYTPRVTLKPTGT